MKNITKQNKFLKKKANFIRDEVITIAVRNNAGHIASSLSCVDILVALYYNCMKYDSRNPLLKNRDRLVFSKAHGCYALYAILADKGFLPKKEWENFYSDSSSLCGCFERRPEYGIEVGCGSLGHGLPIAVGLALGDRLKRKKNKVFCIVGDGELQEGTTWESLQFAVKNKLKNLIVIIDHNRLQAMDFIVHVLDIKDDDLIRRLSGFGLSPVLSPGHDAAKLADCINTAKSSSTDTPKVIIARTVKGFGLRCMENIPKFHFRVPTSQEMQMGRSYE